MTESRVKVSIVIETKDPRNQLTKVEQWQVITSAAHAVQAAIETYVAPSHQQKAREAVGHLINSPLPASIRYGEAMVESPFKDEGDETCGHTTR